MNANTFFIVSVGLVALIIILSMLTRRLWLNLKKQKEVVIKQKMFWSAAKFTMTGIVWFYSSFVVAPLYFIIFEQVVIRPTTWYYRGLTLLSGAIAWFVLIYLLLSLLVLWVSRHRNIF